MSDEKMIPPKEVTNPLRYDNTDDISRRLTKTLVRFRGKPVYIKGVAGNLHVRAYNPLEKGLDFYVHSSDVDLDISSPPLGYTNHDNHSWYLTRRPSRQQIQGIQIQHCMVYPAEKYIQGRGYNDLGDVSRTILGEYPSFEKALERSIVGSQAWSRHLAFVSTKDPGLRIIKHLWDDIGVYSVSGNEGIITKKFSEDVNLISNLQKYMGVSITRGYDEL